MRIRHSCHRGGDDMQIDPIYWKIWWEAIQKQYDAKELLYSVSPDQLKCKKWLVDNLPMHHINKFEKLNIHIFGGWYGYPLIDILLEALPQTIKITNIDLDKKAIDLCRKFTNEKQLDDVVFLKNQNVLDPLDEGSNKDKDVRLVINTSSEHMPDLPEIILNKEYNERCIFILQSNNMEYVEDHINCVSSEQEFIDKSGLSDILYSGTHQMNNGYERYMVIGRR